MTNYIDEMMRTAGVNEIKIVFGCVVSLYDKVCDKKETGKCSQCEYAQIQNKGFPDFTAEKQLEMIKLISNSENSFHIWRFDKTKWHLDTGAGYHEESEAKTFPQALAQLTTELMNAGELDKEKVKEILEG